MKFASIQTKQGAHPATAYRNCALVVALLLAACSGGMQGDYVDNSGMFTYKFKSGGKVEVIMVIMGTKEIVETDYKLEDGNVKVTGQGGIQQVMPIDKNGCLDAGGIVGKLCKKK